MKFPALNNFYFLLALLPVVGGGCRKAGTAPAGFELDPGFQIELIASEPLITDPVAMEIDEYGRLYVVEMPGNPYDESGAGKVKLLADTDGDGRMDKHTVFADSLVMPSGIARWKKGVLVTDPPHVLYLEDTDGDGRADTRETILTGFDSTNLEYNVNNPIVGLDNWIYLGNGPGARQGNIYFPAQPDSPLLSDNAAGHIVRFRPDSRELEMCSGITQFGHTFDEWGRHFLVSNSNHIYQEIMAGPYLRRNPGLPVSGVAQSLSDHGDAAEVFPVTQNPEHQLLTDVGVFTSACGITAYLGGAFPPGFNEGITFVAEPAHNLVHADRLQDSSVSFRAGRLHSEKEFLASADPWFRPVNMYVGPDGALYIVDYYRQIIEGPEFLAEEVRESGDLYNGSDQGRIYRVTASGAKPLDWSQNLRLGEASGEELVEMLNHPNGWWRRNAQRLLIDRSQDNKDRETVVSALVQKVRNEAAPLSRLHALWTLEGLGWLRTEHIVQALQDPVAEIRENAVRLAELHLDDAPELTPALLALQEDADPKVRFQLLCTLGFLDTPQAAEARQGLLFGDVENKWMQIAALSAPASQKDALLQVLLERFAPAHASLVQRLSMMTGASGESEAIHRLLQKATALPAETGGGWQVPVLEGLAAGLGSAPHAPVQRPEQNLLIRTFLEHPADSVRLACLHVLQETGLPPGAQARVALEQAVSMAGDQDLPAERRAGAIQLLALSDPAPYETFLKNLIVPSEPLPVQRAALQVLSDIPGPGVSHYILGQWEGLTPGLRGAAIETFMAYPFDSGRISLLLDAIEAGKIQQTSLDWSQMVRLMRDTPDTLKERAQALLAGNESQRQEVIQQYQSALSLKGDPGQGQEIFQRICATCHMLGGAGGVEFGPDLSTVRNWPAANLLEKILDPGRSVTRGYELWTLTLKTGEVKQGIIAAEAPSGLTLRYPGGEETVIARQDIEETRALNISAMPPGLEKQITEQEMADLLSYIRQAGQR